MPYTFQSNKRRTFFFRMLFDSVLFLVFAVVSITVFRVSVTIFFLKNVFIALKGSHLFTAAGVGQCSGRKMSPYINHSAVYILFWSFEISENILRNHRNKK